MNCREWAALFLIFLHSQFANTQTSWNVELFGQANRGDERYSGSWSYVDADGREYALIGAKSGTAVYHIDDPENIEEVGFVPGPSTNWREMTTLGDFAYVVTDAQGNGHSLQVIDLSYLPDTVYLLTEYTTTFTKAHIIQKAVDSNEPYIYVMGASPNEGVHILDVSDPSAPLEIGLYNPGYYIHDAHIRGNRLYAAALYETTMDIVDITDKTNPVLLGKITYNGKNTHSSSTYEDGKYLILADEADGYPARIFNVEDPLEVEEITSFTANPASLVHNPYVKGKHCYVTHNTEGLRILDIADPSLPVEVGYFDTYAGPSGGFYGLWSACPYFPSGKIIGGDRTEGLYIWEFDQTLAARIYGQIIDSLTGEPLPDAAIHILPLEDTLATDLQGFFKKGMLAGTYSLEISLEGYLPKTLEIEMEQGDSLQVEIRLVPDSIILGNSSRNLVKVLGVYPNPSTGMFYLHWQDLPQIESIIVFNNLGEPQHSVKVNGCNCSQVNLQGLPAGSYWVKALNEAGQTVATTKLYLH